MLNHPASREELRRVYEEELMSAAALRKGTIYMIDGDGNDIVPAMIATHEKKAQNAMEALITLEMSSERAEAF
ncbi:MAG: hypothetical protein V4691_07315 [Pseudomonadota bacterium]